MQRESADIGVQEAREILLRTKRSLAVLLNLPPDQSALLELRGTIADVAPLPAPVDELVELALRVRPDLAAVRLGIGSAEAAVHLARAERFADVYLLYQPYTFQNNAPFGQKSATSWALGATVPIPLYNRNQGVILRSSLNVTQMQAATAALDRLVIAEVTQASREYALSREAVQHYERQVLPAARQMINDSFELFARGDQDALAYYNMQRNYNITIRQYRDALVRHRRSMFVLNTVVGQRILP
jgi:cobalt-zinc-cadmium efflux system outer membrane protein